MQITNSRIFQFKKKGKETDVNDLYVSSMFFTVPWVDSKMPALLASLLLLISMQRLVRGGKHCSLCEIAHPTEKNFGFFFI